MGEAGNSIARLLDLNTWFKGLGEIIIGLSNGISHAISTGLDVQDKIKVRRMHEKTQNILIKILQIPSNQGTLLRNLEWMVDSGDEAQWEIVTDTFAKIQTLVDELLVEVPKNPELALSPGGIFLLEQLSMRQEIIKRLKDIEPPKTPEEIQCVKNIIKEYREIQVQLISLYEELLSWSIYLDRPDMYKKIKIDRQERIKRIRTQLEQGKAYGQIASVVQDYHLENRRKSTID